MSALSRKGATGETREGIAALHTGEAEPSVLHNAALSPILLGAWIPKTHSPPPLSNTPSK